MGVCGIADEMKDLKKRDKLLRSTHSSSVCPEGPVSEKGEQDEIYWHWLCVTLEKQ